ncbi:TPA: hypothetical protein N0F65_000757, partial [Lagenidium giganteum]
RTQPRPGANPQDGAHKGHSRICLQAKTQASTAADMVASTKQFDIVIYGATGFTGELVARYFLSQSETDLTDASAIKWAIAGRNKAKLEKVKEELKHKLPSVSSVVIDQIPVVVADSGNEDAVVAMVRSTRCVLSLVGPYAIYGSLLVKACAENGVHYCDLTGEVVWIEQMIEKYQAVAQQTGARLIHCCGFESVPSELSTMLAAETVIAKTSKAPSEVSMYFTEIQGEASGGTCASVFAMLETSTNDQLLRSQNPFFLTDEATRNDKRALVSANSSKMLMRYERDLKSWSSFFIGGSVNMAVVHRSNYLQKNRYGDKFVYRERLAAGNFFFKALATIGTAFLGVFLYFSWTRALLKRIAPAPGQGPSETVMKNGFFTSKALGYDQEHKLASRVSVRGVGDPGYSLTSKIISECAFCLVKGEYSDKSAAGTTGGFYTPASAIGPALAKRLNDKQLMLFNTRVVGSLARMGNQQGSEWGPEVLGRRPNDNEMIFLYRLQKKMYTRLVESPERYWNVMLSHETADFARISAYWCLDAGFSTENPGDDLRSMGELGLECLVYFAENFPGEAKMMKRNRGGYPFAKAAMAVARALSELLHLVDEQKEKGNFPVAETMYWHLVQSDATFFQLFSLMFMIFEDEYCERFSKDRSLQSSARKCSTALVAELVDVVKLKVLEALKQSPDTVDDLALLCQNGSQIVGKPVQEDEPKDAVERESSWKQHYVSRKNLQKLGKQWSSGAPQQKMLRPPSFLVHPSNQSENDRPEVQDCEQEVEPNHDLFAGLTVSVALVDQFPRMTESERREGSNMGAAGSKENEAAAMAYVDRVLEEHPVAIFSKTYCPYCDMAKDVMKLTGVKYHVVELDQKNDSPTGAEIQAALAVKTGIRTVPNVFLKGSTLGGGSDVQALYQCGKLDELLRKAGLL